jgi:hypothetical protein
MKYVFILDCQNNNINNHTGYNNSLIETKNGEQKTSERNSKPWTSCNGGQKVNKVKSPCYNSEFTTGNGIHGFGFVL